MRGKKFDFCVQVEHVHPSPGSVWCWGSISRQDPRLLLSMSLLLKPVLQGIHTRGWGGGGEIVSNSTYLPFNYPIDRLRHRWGSGNGMEEMAWLSCRTEHGSWIFWLGRWVCGSIRLSAPISCHFHSHKDNDTFPVCTLTVLFLI